MTSAATPIDHSEIIGQVLAHEYAMPSLSTRHLELIRRLRTMWSPLETGGPGIDLWNPLGSQPTIEAAMEILRTKDEAFAVRTLAETCRLVLPFILETGALAPGRYSIPEDLRGHFEDRGQLDAEGCFEFRAEHLLLLRYSNWQALGVNDDFGDSGFGQMVSGDCWPMPMVEGKRPYGMSSYFQLDIAMLLGEPYALDAHGDAIDDPDKDDRFERLHFDLELALQTYLLHATPVTALA